MTGPFLRQPSLHDQSYLMAASTALEQDAQCMPVTLICRNGMLELLSQMSLTQDTPCLFKTQATFI